MIRNILCIFTLLSAAALPLPALAQQKAATGTGAIIRGLNKVNGEVTDFKMRSGQIAKLGHIRIALRECRYPAGNPSGNAFAALEVSELGQSGTVFSGWMIASSPALNAMDHPRYDVWVLRCTTS